MSEERRAPADRMAARWFRDAFAGSLAALVSLSYAASYGTMIFGDGLARYAPRGIPAVLVSCSVILFVTALRSSLPFTVAGPDSNATAVLAAMCASLAVSVVATGNGGDSVLYTVLAALFTTSLVTGGILFVLGARGWGRVVQLVPYSVIGGFLAGTGYLIVSGAFRTATGRPLDGEALEHLARARPEGLATALAVAVALLFLSRRTKHFLVVPGVIVVAASSFLGVAAATGTSHSLLTARGLLLEPPVFASFTTPLSIPVHEVRWDLIVAHTPDMASVVAVTLMSILLNSAGIELAVRRDVDFDRELRAAGVANLCAGLAGGIVGYQSISRTLLNQRAGATTRLAAVWASAVCVVVTVAWPRAVTLLPKPVMAGLLLYLGVSLLIEWTVSSYARLPRHEYALVLAMSVGIGRFGFLAGVFLGLLASCVLFAVKYGEASTVRVELTAATHRSRVERTLRQQRVLAESAHATVGMCLQGYLFFGSANRVVERVSRLVAPGVRHLVVDFRLVQGMDTSAQLAFTKIERICTQHAVTLVLCALGPLHAAFERAGVIGRGAVACKDLDAALEWTERRLLAEGGDATKGRPLRALLSPYFRPESLERLLFLLEAVETERGVTLFDVGGRAEPIVFVEQGVVSLSSVQPGGDRVRLGSYGPGTVLGGSELLAHGARCGWVTVEEPGRVFRLTRDKLRELERTSPAVAVELKNLLIETLSSRLAIVNQHVASL